MLTIKLNHDKNDMVDVLNLTKEQSIKSKAAMIFGILSPKVLADSLFDDESEIPSDMKTISGCIEKVLSICENDEMRVYSLLNFYTLNEKISQLYILSKDRSKVDELINDEKDELKKALKMIALQIKLQPFSNILEVIKKANGDFNLFYDEVKESMEKAEDFAKDLNSDDNF
jgi:hypothetical protein